MKKIMSTLSKYSTCFSIFKMEVCLKMNALTRKEFWVFLAFIMLAPVCAQTVSALDNLFLTGFLRSFDSKSGLIRIDVTSEGCKGLREFKEPEGAKADMDASLIGKQIHFYIDSSVCERGQVYTILAR